MKKNLPLVTVLLSVLLLTSFLFWKSYDLRRESEEILGRRHSRERTNIDTATDGDFEEEDDDWDDGDDWTDTPTDNWYDVEPTSLPEGPPPTQIPPTLDLDLEDQDIGSPADYTPAFQFRLIIEPQHVTLRPLQEQRFKAYIEKSNGQRKKAQEEHLNWRVINGGGTINQEGVFQAWDSPGTYRIRVEYRGKSAAATVRIELRPVTIPTPRAQVTTPPGVAEPTSSLFPTEYEFEPAVTPPPGEPVIRRPSPVDTEREPVRRVPTIRPPGLRRVIEKPEHSFRYIEEDTKQCLKFVLGEEGYQKYFDPEGERRDPGELKEVKSAIDRCFKISREPDFDSEAKRCLVERLGEDRYNWITGQVASPSRKELYAASGCFTEPRYVTYKPQEEVSEFSQSCLEVKFGRERYRELINKQTVPTNEELAAGRECFNIEENIARPPLIIESTDEQTSCLRGILGEERYNAIYNQGQSPSADEINATKACFESAENSQEVFLPPPPEQVPFIPESKQDAQIEAINVQVQETRAVIQLQGKAEPNSTVDIYIFSEPIVVTTQTDANGNWFYELSYHLPEGEHKAYAVVHHPEKGLVKSELLAFNVALAAEPVEGAEVPVPQIEVVESPRVDLTRIYLWIALIIVNLGGALLIGLQFLRFQGKEAN